MNRDKRDKKKQETSTKSEFPVFTSVFLWLIIIVSSVMLLIQLVASIGVADDTPTTMYFVIEAVIISAVFIIYRKQSIFGLYLFYAMLLVQIPMGMILGAASVGGVMRAVIIKAVVMSLIVFIPSKGVSAFDVMKGRGKGDG